ncbi:hypothetical protein GEV39_07285 [Pseudomonas sp. NY5710]|nr:hypothetical protein GEV39_07285 [Pseudomonas sp. NY5710]
MFFEWDEAKNQINIRKHGIDFADVPEMFNHPMLTSGRPGIMTESSKTDWGRLARQDDKDIDTTDIPELDQAFFRQAELHVPAKQAVTIRLDADVLAWFKEQGSGYQTRINQLLRQYMHAQRRQR